MNQPIFSLNRCNLCPHNCNADRSQKNGFCRSGLLPKAALAQIHYWEEPPISGINGSGTVFFSNCNLKCVFCQNHMISHNGFGKEVNTEYLAKIFLNQQAKGVHNLNLVSAGHYLIQVKDALLLAKKKGLKIPVVYNTNGYEKVDSLKMLEGLVDIYLPDLKYYDDTYALKYSSAPNYFKLATMAILEMYRQCQNQIFDENGIMRSGVIIRHLILPGLKEDSIKILDWIKENLDNNVTVSLLNQYTPMYHASSYKEISRKLTTFEYQKVVDHFLKIGLKNGYIQKKTSANISYTPTFDLSGLD